MTRTRASAMSPDTVTLPEFLQRWGCSRQTFLRNERNGLWRRLGLVEYPRAIALPHPRAARKGRATATAVGSFADSDQMALILAGVACAALWWLRTVLS